MLPDLLRFEPLMVERTWGGRWLERLGRQLPPAILVGESWEIADLPPADPGGEDRCTVVATGPLAGEKPSDLIGRYGVELLGSAGLTPDGRFPLLVKLLDAREHLSVQVHPPDQIAESDPAIRAKTESWYVLDTEPESMIWLDIRTDVDQTDLVSAAGTHAFVDLLGNVPANVGDFHHIPSGRVHSLGAGAAVLEVQTPSDTTFRIYDWNDIYDRSPRELHLEAAVRSIVRGDPAAVSIPAAHGSGVRTLVATPDYWIREHRTDGDQLILEDRRELRVIVVVTGEVEVGGELLTRGDIRVLPATSAAVGPLSASPDGVMIEVGLV